MKFRPAGSAHIVPVILALTFGLVVACQAGPNPFGNVSNVPFNTRCSGPQGAIVIEEPPAGGVSTMSTHSAVTTQHSTSNLAGTRVTLQRLKRAGVVSPDAEVRFPRTVVHTQNGKLVLPDLQQARVRGEQIGDPANRIAFEFEGFNSQDEEALRAYLDTAVPKARLIYGPPAFDITVTIIQDESINAIQGGTYDVTANEIHIPPLTGNFPEDTYILIMLVLNAFHDDAIVFYDAWEQGFIGAAAYIVQTTPGVSPGYNPIDPGPFYALSVYEPENQPELANPTFYPESGTDNMLVWRIAMARAAWLKCYIEDDQFFRDFNSAYYAAYDEDLPGNVPALKMLCRQVLPQVEGRPFFEWFETNYVLDTSTHLGPKLYVWNIPLEQSVALIAELYDTLPGGDEEVMGGQARTIYWSYDFSTKLYAEEGNVIDIADGGDSAGEGFLLPTFFNIGGPQRVTVEVEVTGLVRRYPYPYGERGFDTSGNNLYGAILGAAEGTINVTGGDGISDLEMERGVWGDRITTGELSPMQVEITFENQRGQTVTRTYNIGWDSYCTFLDGARQARVTHTFAVGSNGLHMMTLPMQPVSEDMAAVLGVSADRLLMAQWDATREGADKYAIYPDISPFAPGQAYWLRLFSDANVNTLGRVAPEDEPFTMYVPIGWNMIGSPRLNPVSLADVQVSYRTSDPVPYEEAVNNGWVQADLFGYTQGAGYDIAETFEPFEGYWLRVLRSPGVYLTFPSGVQSEQIGTAKEGADEKVAWKLRLQVEAGRQMSRCAYLGATDDATEGADPAYDLLAPPDFGDYVRARFSIPGESSYGASWATDIRPVATGTQRWDVQVASSHPNTPVTLRWPDLSGLPGDVRPVLVDPDTGQRQYMRTTTHATFAAGPEGLTKDLVIEVTEDTGNALALTGVSAACTESSAVVSYHLSRPAAVDARVMNIAGRQIARIAGSGIEPAGTGTRVWNLRSSTGTPVPSGTYLISLRARAEDGQQTNALRSISVSR